MANQGWNDGDEIRWRESANRPDTPATMLLRVNGRTGSLRFREKIAGTAASPRSVRLDGRTGASHGGIERTPSSPTRRAGLMSSAATPRTGPIRFPPPRSSGRRRVSPPRSWKHRAAGSIRARHPVHRRRPAGRGGARASQSSPAASTPSARRRASEQTATGVSNRQAIFRKQ